MDNIFPSCGRILALEVMFDGISEHVLMFKNVLCCVVFSKIIRIFVAKTACNKRVPLLHGKAEP